MSVEMDEYLFDLRGYLMLEGAVEADHQAELNAILDTYQDLEPGEWRGWVRRSPNSKGTTRHLHQVFEMGEPFERLIDHPSWIDHITRFVGGDDGLFIDESFADIRQQTAATPLHSGAHKRRIRTQYRYHNGQFRCGQINILLALRDVGPGDGGTMVIPSSHKSNLLHPAFESGEGRGGLENVEGAVEVSYNAGDALMFVDCLAHGSAERVNDGERRILIIRYGPHWGTDRYGYQPSPELVRRLTPERRQIVQPLPPITPPNVEGEYPKREPRVAKAAVDKYKGRWEGRR